MATEAQTKMLLTVEEAARRLGIGRSLAWRLVQEGEIPSVRLGRLVRVPMRQLEEWLQAQSREQTKY